MTPITERLLSSYVSPINRTSLTSTDAGLEASDRIFPFLPGVDARIPDFRDTALLADGGKASLGMYDFKGAREIYRNFLSWLYRTFEVNEEEFRADLIGRLRLAPGSRLLITGCGIGDDLVAVLNLLDSNGSVFASDLAPEMVVATREALLEMNHKASAAVSLSVCDACHLPFEDGYFDAAFHFGGINLFDDVRLAIDEMARVTRDGGRVVFGDEGIAPWLASSEYGRMAVANNYLWAAKAPVDLLPHCAVDVSLNWVLGNCFYVIEFEKQARGPFMNPDVPHVGRRGGSMRTRYFGQLEGVSVDLKQQVLKEAASKNVSVKDWLENAIKNALDH